MILNPIEIESGDRASFSKVTDAIKKNFNETYEEPWGKGVLRTSRFRFDEPFVMEHRFCYQFLQKAFYDIKESVVDVKLQPVNDCGVNWEYGSLYVVERFFENSWFEA